MATYGFSVLSSGVSSTGPLAQMSPQQSPNGKKTICASRNTKNPNRAEIGKRETEEEVAYQLEGVALVLKGSLVLLLLPPLAGGLDRVPYTYGHQPPCSPPLGAPPPHAAPPPQAPPRSSGRGGAWAGGKEKRSEATAVGWDGMVWFPRRIQKIEIPARMGGRTRTGRKNRWQTEILAIYY